MNLESYCNSHYGNSMKPGYMRKWGRAMAKSLQGIIDSGKFPILVYRGMSGVTTATTIANFLKSTTREGRHYAMMYVRKEDEKSHGNNVEYTECHPNDREVVWVFCDDFISTGKTVMETFRVILNRFDDEIPFDSILYALTLDYELWPESKVVNNLHDALVNRNDMFNRRDEIMLAMRNEYDMMEFEIAEAKKEAAERQAEFIKNYKGFTISSKA